MESVVEANENEILLDGTSVDVELGDYVSFERATSPRVLLNDVNPSRRESRGSLTTIPKSSKWVISPRIAVNPEDLKYTVFLFFLNHEFEIEYRKYMKKQIYAPSFWIFTILIVIGALARANYDTSFSLGYLYILDAILHMFTLLVFIIYMINKL